MKQIAFGVAALTLLTGCVSGASGTNPVPAPSASERQCMTAVMMQANTADVQLLGSRPVDVGTLVRVGVGEDRTPWRCVSFVDGTTGDIAPIGQGGQNIAQGNAASDGNSFDELSCRTSVMQRANTADVTVLGSRQTDNGVLVRLGVGPDRTPWRCRSFSDGSVGDIGPIRHGGQHGGQHGGTATPGDFSPRGIYEQACLLEVNVKADTLNARVLGSRVTDRGLRVRVGVGPDRTPWQCLAQEDGSTRDVRPIRHNDGQ